MELKSGRHTFKVVDYVPGGIVWNIGRHNFPFEGYVPCCHAGYKNNPYWVNPDSLTAYNIGNEKLALLCLDLASHKDLPCFAMVLLREAYDRKDEYLMRYLSRVERIDNLLPRAERWTKRYNFLLRMKWDMQEVVRKELKLKVK